ncbi:MAG: hypothetical protein PWP23_2876 [Candidatus Sumerlaeota bacterium]|nr:hypothetical protein [Candidatus Sumerlaeota bacterium]
MSTGVIRPFHHLRPRFLTGLLLSFTGFLLPGAQAQEVNVSDGLAAAPTTATSSLPRLGGSDGAIAIQGERGFYTENDVAHGVGRTTVTFDDMTISADVLSIDMITQQLDAEGNVVFTTKDDEVRASAGHYDFRRMEGVAYDAEGVTGTLHFRTEWDEEKNGPSFRRISEDEALFRGASYTTSGFPVPTWRIEAREIILVPGERVFMRGATLFVRDTPIFYLPVYSRSLQGSSPWSFEIGSAPDYGTYASVRYRFHHESKVPDYNDPAKYITRSTGRLGLRTDFFTGGAIGVGIDYKYKFDFEKHIGSLELYGVRENVREIEDESDGGQRYLYRHRHNSLFGKTMFQLSTSWMSDPEVEYDFFDPFLDEARGRRPERRARAALTYLEEDWVARISGEIKDRVTLSRYGDPTEIQDDDLNYATDPNLARTGDDSDGIDSDRYGRVTERFDGRVATRMLPFFGDSLFWDAEFNAFRALDAGFNELSDDDDALLTGVDYYNSLTHRMKLDRQGRFTWLNTVGIGAGFYRRNTDDLVSDSIRIPGGIGAVPVDGQRYIDRETIALGAGSRQLSYDDVRPYYLWADYVSRLNARFTENLSGYLKYTNRIGTSRSAGAFYEEAGRLEAFEDIYDFPVEKHWIEAFLNYSPLYPKIETYLAAGYNLQSRSDIFANEKQWYAGVGTDYESDSGEVRLGASSTLSSYQARDRGDPNEFDFEELSGRLYAEYLPRHGRYWASLTIDGSIPLSDDPVAEANRKQARFTENRSDVSIRPVIGRQFGPKYDVELMADYNTRISGLKEAGVLIVRDIYDADLSLFLGARSTTSDSEDDNDNTNEDRPESNLEPYFRFGLTFKVPEESQGLSAVSLKTMRDRRRAASFVE